MGGVLEQGGAGWQMLTALNASSAVDAADGMSVQTASLASNPWAVNGAYQGVSPQHRDMRPSQRGNAVDGAGPKRATSAPMDPMDYTLGGA